MPPRCPSSSPPRLRKRGHDGGAGRSYRGIQAPETSATRLAVGGRETVTEVQPPQTPRLDDGGAGAGAAPVVMETPPGKRHLSQDREITLAAGSGHPRRPRLAARMEAARPPATTAPIPPRNGRRAPPTHPTRRGTTRCPVPRDVRVSPPRKAATGSGPDIDVGRTFSVFVFGRIVLSVSQDFSLFVSRVVMSTDSQIAR